MEKKLLKLKTGRIVLQAKFFSEIVKKLPIDTVEIEVENNHLQTIIRSGKSEFNLNGLMLMNIHIYHKLKKKIF